MKRSGRSLRARMALAAATLAVCGSDVVLTQPASPAAHFHFDTQIVTQYTKVIQQE
jgi:hypothetical protein